MYTHTFTHGVILDPILPNFSSKALKTTQRKKVLYKMINKRHKIHSSERTKNIFNTKIKLKHIKHE